MKKDIKMFDERVALNIFDVDLASIESIPAVRDCLKTPTSSLRLMMMYYTSVVRDVCSFIEVDRIERFLANNDLVKENFDIDTTLGSLIDSFSSRICVGEHFDGGILLHQELEMTCPELAVINDLNYKNLMRFLPKFKWNSMSLSVSPDKTFYLTVGPDTRIIYFHMKTGTPYEFSNNLEEVQECPAYAELELFR